MTCCHHSALCHSPKQDQNARNSRPLCVARARHAGSEHRFLRGRKREGVTGRRAFWKESYPRVQRGKTHVLAVRTIRSSERSICMGFPQTGHAFAVAVIGVQEGPARTAVTARHLQQRRLLLLEICMSFAGWLHWSGTRTAAVLMALRRRWIQPSRGRWFQLRGVSTASRLPGSVRVEVFVVAEGEDI